MSIGGYHTSDSSRKIINNGVKDVNNVEDYVQSERRKSEIIPDSTNEYKYVFLKVLLK